MPDGQASLSDADLGALFGTQASASERARALTDFAAVVRARV
jgi:hypothetical protein